MNNISNNNKRILETLVMISIVALASACSPVRFSQGSKAEIVNESSTPGNVTPGVTPGDSVTPTTPSTPTTTTGSLSGYGGDPFDLIDPVTHEHFTFSAITHPFEQTEVDPTRDTTNSLSFNYRDFRYNGSGACTVTQSMYELNSNAFDGLSSWAELFPAVTSTLNLNQTNSACKSAEIASRIKSLAAGGSCVASNQSLSSSEITKLNTTKITTPESGGDATHILLEATLLQSSYGNNLPPTINLDANCRCFYTFQRSADKSVNVMGLQEHCAAHFSNWNY
jgi:hypothetical protein